MPRYLAPLPDLISGFRIGLAVAFPLLAPQWRLPTVIVAGISDGLDGFIARRFGLQSVTGAMLDALADKAFTLSALLTLAASGTISWWQLPLLLARDGAVVVIALYLMSVGNWRAFQRMMSGVPGKITTVLLFLWLISILIAFAGPAETALFVMTAVASVATAAIYLGKFLRALARDRRARALDQ